MLVKNLDRIASNNYNRDWIEELPKNNPSNLPLFIMMVGIPGSGKTTRAEAIAKDERINGVVLSSDVYREKIAGNSKDVPKNEKVFEALYKDLLKFLEVGQSVILDATNTTAKTRRRAFEKIKAFKTYRVAYVVNEPYYSCCLRNELRDRVVPKEALEKFLYGFEVPMLFEGFDKIVLHCPYDANNGNYAFYEILYEKMAGFNQRTRWHRHNLLPHCIIAYDYLKELQEKEVPTEDKKISRILLEAAKVHDFGKLYTGKKKPDGSYSYAGHANVGAYNLLSFLREGLVPPGMNEEEFLEMIFYVNYHMYSHMLVREETKEETKKAFLNKIGAKLYNNLMLLEEADEFASGRGL